VGISVLVLEIADIYDCVQVAFLNLESFTTRPNS
jgi:hypothetical protein